MRTRTKIYVDRLLGLPLTWLLNLAARALGKLLRRDHSVEPDNVHVIVVAKYAGMGSIVQATPLLRSLRGRFPRARIIFLTSQSCRGLVERLEHIDDVISISDRSLGHVVQTSFAGLLLLIRARVDIFFDLEVYSAYATIMALLSLTRNRIGFFRESTQHKRGIYTHLLYFNTRNPIRHIYLQLGRVVGCIPVQPNALGTIRIDSEDRAEIATKLASVEIGEGSCVVVNPNASDLMVERRWPLARFVSLIERIHGEHRVTVVLIGAPQERAYVAELVAQLGASSRARTLNLAGELSLGGLFALLKRARLVITNDTGPMHMAWALGVPTICLFGPVDPQHYGWHGPGVEVLHKPVYCSPCVHEVDEPPCGGNNVCMQRIEIDEVAAATACALSDGSSSSNSPALGESFFVNSRGQPLGVVVRGSLTNATKAST